jgi:PAS domain-containing protein
MLQQMLTASEKDIAQAALVPGPHAIISADRDGVIREWNLIAERIFDFNVSLALKRMTRLGRA